MKTGFTSMRLAIVAFIVPFFFVLQPELLLIGDTMNIAQTCITSLVAMYALGGGMQGWLLTNTNLVERTVLIVSGVAMLYPGTLTDLIGVGLLVAVIILQFTRMKLANKAAV